MIDGRKDRGGRDARGATAWYAVWELRRAQVFEREGGKWKRPRAESLTLEEGVSLLRAASGIGYRAIPTLLDYALHPLLGRDSLHLTLSLLSEADVIQRLWLDRRLRRSTGWGGRATVGGSWWQRRAAQQLTPQYAGRALGPLPKAAWMLFTMSPDGGLREEALGELEHDGDVMALAHVLMRTLDWVREVRRKAAAVWARALREIPPEDLIPLMPLVAHLASGTWQERAAYDTQFFARLDPVVVRQFSDRFGAEHGEAVLLNAVRKAGSREARASFSLLTTVRPFSRSVLEVALRSADVTIQRRGFAHAIDDDGLRRQAIELGFQSKFAEIRRQALRQIAMTVPDSTAPYDALFDRSETVRSFARFLVKAAGGNPSAPYREALTRPDDTRRLVAAILGLADLERDWLVAADHLADARPKVRAAAVLAIFRSDREVAREALPSMIGDPSPAVSSAARAGLDGAGHLPFGDLGPYLDDPRLHVWRNAARLMHASGPWPWLLGALRLARSEDPVRSCVGIAQLRRWGARRYVPREPPPAEVRPALEAAASGVPVFPRLVVDSFKRFDLILPEFDDVLAASTEDIEVAARDVATACEVRLVKRHNGRRGGWHYASRPDPDRDFFVQETIVVQRNRDYDHPAELEFTGWPTLVYVLATTKREKRIASLRTADIEVLRTSRSERDS